MINKKLDEIFTSGVEVRLLNKEEYIQKLKKKVMMGQRLLLFHPIKPTTIEEIEQNKDELWRVWVFKIKHYKKWENRIKLEEN